MICFYLQVCVAIFLFFRGYMKKKRKKMGRAIVVLFTRSLFSSLLFLHSSSSYSTLFWDWGYKFCSGFSTIFIKQVLKKFFNIFCNTFIQSLSINKLVKTWKQKLILFFVFCIFLNPFLYLLSFICTEFLNIVQEIGRDFFCYNLDTIESGVTDCIPLDALYIEIVLLLSVTTFIVRLFLS